MTLRPSSEWERDYRSRLNRLSCLELQRMLRDAEEKKDFRRALAIQRERDARHRAVLLLIDGGHHG